MKKLLSWFVGLSFATVSQATSLIPPVVSDVDLGSFLGRWYEVASTKPFFQRDCVCVTADYSLLPNDTVEVVNSCRKDEPSAELTEVVLNARTTKNPAKLKVGFGPFPAPFSNYWIVDLADDYRYAVISTRLRSPVWILSRTPEIDSHDLAGIYERLDHQGFRVSKITPTLQAGCPATL